MVFKPYMQAHLAGVGVANADGPGQAVGLAAVVQQMAQVACLGGVKAPLLVQPVHQRHIHTRIQRGTCFMSHEHVASIKAPM